MNKSKCIIRLVVSLLLVLLVILRSTYIVNDIKIELSNDKRDCLILSEDIKCFWDGEDEEGNFVGGHKSVVLGIYKSNSNDYNIGKFETEEYVDVGEFNSMYVPVESSLSMYYTFIDCIIFSYFIVSLCDILVLRKRIK